jgi:hypothetical protein
VLGIAGRTADNNEQQLSAGNRRVDRLLLSFQRRFAATLLAALALGSVMAAFSMCERRRGGEPKTATNC